MSLDRLRLGHTVTRLRKQAGLTQVDLAARARVGRSSISEIETGYTYPSLTTAVNLADAFGITVDELIEEAR